MFSTTVRNGVVAGALAIAAVATPTVLAAGTANAMPISTLQAECRGIGGSWVNDWGTINGRRAVIGYMCFYNDINGSRHVDYYDRRGNYRWSG